MFFVHNNINYSGFETFTVTSNMDSLANGFEIVSNNRWIGADIPIKAGDPCQIIDLNGESLLTGYIDMLEPSIGGSIAIRGRSKAGDLVDCVAAGNGELAGLTLQEIAAQLAAPFGISVTGETGTVVKRFRYALDAPVVDIIREFVTRQGFICRSDGPGDLIIEAAGATRAPIVLQEGVNILSGRGQIAGKGQFSTYRVLSQSETSNTVQSSFEGKSPRYRPFCAISGGSYEIQDSQKASEWLARNRDGGATSFTVTVADIQNLEPNTLIDTESPTLGISGTMLIRSVTRRIDSSGSTTTLGIVNPYAFGLDYVANDFMD